MFCNENLYYLLCSCTNPIFGKILVPEIWAKMFSANQVAGFFIQPYLQNKSMKWLVFLHVDTNSHKLKVDQEIFGWAWPEWVWSVWSRDSKIGCISRMNWWKELIFLQGGANSGKQKVISNDFWVGLVKNGHGHSVHETLKSAEYVYRLSWFFTCWLWCNNFLLDQHWLFFFTFKSQSTAVVLVSPLTVAGRILWKKVCPAFPPDICLLSWNLIFRFLFILPGH